MKDETKVSKQMAYLLRHDPSGMSVSDEGFVDLDELLKKLRKRWKRLSSEDVRKIVERDPKGRYEIKDGKIRARYGHSIDVDPTLTQAEVDTLYHGTPKAAAESILKEGLKSKGRQKVHLSRSVEDAKEVGKRRTDSPVILEVDVKSAKKEGVSIERASDRVFVTDYIPPKFISRKNIDDGS